MPAVCLALLAIAFFFAGETTQALSVGPGSDSQSTNPALRSRAIQAVGLTAAPTSFLNVGEPTRQGNGRAAQNGLPDVVDPISAHWFPSWEEVQIYWPVNSGDGGSAITQYELQIDEGEWMSTAGADWKGCTLHSDFGLIPGNSYQIRVRAVNANGAGQAGETAITLTVPPNAPEPSAESGDNSITLSWNEPADGGSPITGYGVTYFKYQDGAPPVFVQTTQLEVTHVGASSSHTLDALEGGTSYLFHVWAITDAGWGPAGSISAIAGPAAVPAAPAIARVHAGNESLVINWNAPSQPGAVITAYDLRYREGDDADAEWREVDAAWNSGDGGELSYVLDRLTNAQIYSVQILAENSEGESSWSEEASGTPQADAGGAPDWGKPSISGTAAVGRKLTIDITGINNPDDALHHFGFRYRWLRSGTPISGATGASYILSEADRDQAIAVGVTFLTKRGHALSSTSDSTDPVPGPGGGQMSCSVAADTDTDVRVASRQSGDPGSDGYQADAAKSDSSNVVTKGPDSVSTVGPRADNEAEEVVFDVDENTAAFEHIGAPVAGPDANRTYAYSLENGHVSYFGINGKTGQLLVGAPLDFEDRSEYEVVVIARDNLGGTTRIPVTINVNNLDESGIVSLSWRRPQLAVAVEASLSDRDGEVSAVAWQWLRGDSPRGSFSEINNATSATYAPGSADLGKYLRASATYTDPLGSSKTASATSLVPVRAAPTANSAPAFYLDPSVYTSGYDCDPHVDTKFCPRVNRYTTPGMSIYYPTKALDSDHDEVKYSVGGTESDKFAINEFNGELLTAVRFDDVANPPGPGDKTYQLTITASDPSGLSNSIAVEIELGGSRGAVVVEGPREIKFPENGTWRVAAFRATITKDSAPFEVNGWIVSVEPGGGDGDYFDIDDEGILTFTSPPDFDNPKDTDRDNEYNFMVTAYDPNPPLGQRPAQTFVSIRVFVTDARDEFEIRGPASVPYPENGTHPVASYSAPNVVGALNWLPPEGADGAKFTINSSGVLRFRSPPDFEANASADGDSAYVVSVVVRDQNETLRKEFVQIDVTDVNESPTFDEGARAIRNVDDNAAAGDPVGNPVTATDPDAEARLTYSLGGDDAALFAIENDTGQLKTSTEPLDPQLTYTVTVSVSDGIPDSSADDSITITIAVIDINERPEFDPGLDRSINVPENTLVGADIGDPFTATDPENDPNTYTLSGDDAASFGINTSTGQLWLDELLDYESLKKSYSITIYVSDNKDQYGNRDRTPDDEIDVTVNVTDVNEPPQLPGGPITLVVPENSEPNRDIGNPLTATDPEGDFLTYTLDEVSALTFDILSSIGQLTTKAALDHEANPSYTVSVSVSDGKNEAGGIDPSVDHTISVTINVTDVNESPTLVSGPITLEVDENKPAGTNIGGPLAAAPDPENDRLTYTLSGAGDEAFFDVDSTGQLKTKAVLDFEHSHGPSYYITVAVTDGRDQNFNPDPAPDNEIGVTINVTDVNEPPRFEDRSPARSVLETGTAGEDIGGPVSATDPENRALTHTLGGQHASLFDIVASTGQLRVDSTLDFDTQSRYTVTVSVSDGEDSEFNSDPAIDDTVTVTINVTDVNRAPQFPGTTADRSVPENTPADQAIGEPLSATDDEGDQLTYSLGGTDSAFFDLDPDNGQLKTLAALDYEHSHGPSYSVTVSVTDGKRADGTLDETVDDTVAVTITVEDIAIPSVPAAPSVAPGGDRALSITWTPETPAVNQPIDGYAVRYRVKDGLNPDWIENAGNVSVSGNSAIIDELDYGVIYEVQLQARNSEGPSGWSATGEGQTDLLKLSVAYGQASYSVNEGDDLSVMVTVSPTTDRELEIPISVAPGSAETEDYQITGLSNDALLFATGSEQMLFTITTVDDADGSNEVLTLAFGSLLPGDVSTGVPATARVTIVDGDRSTTGGGGGGGGGSRNRRATGKPVISGLPEVGQELTVSTDGIADLDGLTNVSYRYNWIRELDGAIAVIPLQSGDSYTLTEADIDHTIRVRVSFRDDRRNSESLTSDPTALVAAAFGRRSSQQPPIQAEPNAFSPPEAPIITVLDNRYVEGPGNDNLKHNIPNLEIAWKDITRTADFLTHYDITGGLERWGYPVSEVLVLESGALTQFYQRGAVDFHNVGQGWAIERRLTWEYVGGIDNPNGDQGTEPLLTNPHPGRLTGPWGHKVSNYSVDGVEVHFAEVHHRLGQTLAFGYPLSDARINFLVPGLLHAPSTTPGFVRQFFQAAIFEYHPIYPDNPVMLTLLGDILRDILVPNHAIHAPFNAQPELEIGQLYKPYYVNDAVG